MSRPKLIKISELARLSGVPTPTIKHYIREGLLPEPARRTSRNMAYYDPRLADRVRTIKTLQQAHFLPLKLIGDLLEPAPSASIRDDLDDETRQRLGSLEPAITAGQQDSRDHRDAAGQRWRSREEVLATCRITEPELEQLAELGLASAVPNSDGAIGFSGADLEMIEVIDRTREKGMGELFPMSILEPYVAAVRSLVRMELELFRRRVIQGAQLPDAPMQEVARDATHLAERMVVAMRSKLILAELKRLTEGNN